jgi:hypothetical protein
MAPVAKLDVGQARFEAEPRNTSRLSRRGHGARRLINRGGITTSEKDV